MRSALLGLCVVLGIAALYLERVDVQDRIVREARQAQLDSLQEQARIIDNLARAAFTSSPRSFDGLADAVEGLHQQRLAFDKPASAAGQENLRKFVEAVEVIEREQIEPVKRLRAASRNSQSFVSTYLKREPPPPEANEIGRALAVFLVAPDDNEREDALSTLEDRLAASLIPEEVTIGRHLRIVREANKDLSRVRSRASGHELSATTFRLVEEQRAVDVTAQLGSSRMRTGLLVFIILLAVAAALLDGRPRDGRERS